MAETLDDVATYAIGYRDTQGHLQTIQVTSGERKAIKAVREQARRDDAKWREKHRSFTDVEIRAESIVDALDSPAPPRDLGNAWEGPRYRFAWLVGESRTWQGEPVLEVEGKRYCTMCWDQELPLSAYCLGCDSCGRDDILGGTKEQYEQKCANKRAHLEDGLKGGLAGKP